MVVEHDFYRHALHDLGEIAGGIVGRQQREFETAGRRQAVDMAPEFCAVEAVDGDFNGLAVAHMRELGFLEIRDDIDRIQRHHRHQLRSGLHELADAQRTRSDGAVNRRGDLRVGQVQRRLRFDRAGAIQLRHGLGAFAGENVDFSPRRQQA